MYEVIESQREFYDKWLTNKGMAHRLSYEIACYTVEQLDYCLSLLAEPRLGGKLDSLSNISFYKNGFESKKINYVFVRWTASNGSTIYKADPSSGSSGGTPTDYRREFGEVFTKVTGISGTTIVNQDIKGDIISLNISETTIIESKITGDVIKSTN